MCHYYNNRMQLQENVEEIEILDRILLEKLTFEKFCRNFKLHI